MNLKQAFYKDYYKGIDFRKPQDDTIKRHNKDVFEEANRKLFKYAFRESEYQQLALSNFSLPNYDSFDLSTIYPGLLTGVGMVHETNNEGELMLGFFFDHVSGLPMLPGSGVKGALRSAFPQFKTKPDNPIIPLLTAEMDKESYFDKQKAKAHFIASIFPPFSDLKEGDEKLYIKVHQLEMAIFQGMDILAKKENPKADGQLPMAKRCRFLEAIIKDSANSGKKIVGIDALTPHGNNPLKNPVPLPFLKVLPNVVFQFQFMLPDLLMENNAIKGTDLLELFKNILLYFGLGAKTNVGYGQFEKFEKVTYVEGQELNVEIVGFNFERKMIVVKVEGEEETFEVGGGKKGKEFNKVKIGDKRIAIAKKPNPDGSLNNLTLKKEQ